MRIIHITGPIGSGKTTLEMCLRNELGALNIKSETAGVANVLFIGRVHKKNTKNTKKPYLKFGASGYYKRKF
jgi:molybdopterin-guanine dinucleotide biosynthesis protein